MGLADDEHFMALALEQARLGVGLTSPNPAVGAMLVKDGKVIGEGWHRKAGLAHAEVEALKDAAAKGHETSGATAYVTLEPCSTQGRTGACTAALAQAKVARVVYGACDPNPAHAGAADRVLGEAGIEVTAGVLEAACKEMIRPFAKWITTGVPYVIAKCGQSLDGRITRPAGESSWITSEAARAHAMGLRVRCDAILVGGETLRRDDSRLTLRGPDIPPDKEQPWRVVLSRSGNLPAEAAVFTDAFKERTMVLKGQRAFDAVLQELSVRQICCVLLECGGDLMGQAFAAKAVDEVVWYVAPRICGGGVMAVGGSFFGENARSVMLAEVRHQSLGDNLLVSGYPVWN